MAQAAPQRPALDPESGAAAQTEPSSRSSARARREAALDETKRSFLRMASHELRTPLNSILGFSEIIASELYGPLGAPQYKEYAGIIRTSGARLLKLVNQVLEIARLEGRAMDIDLQQESVDHALDDVLDGLREEIAQAGVTIVIENQGALPAVIADARGLRNILTNLIQNAVIFAPEGSQIAIRAEPVDRCVDISIVDHGPGIDPADIPRLLLPFEQGENALTRRSEGAGLGLPIVELLCLAMDGRLKLTSAAGQGLTANVRLPAA
jgi:signal transduction histidine kinase